jgi:hypothetical protein
MDEFTSVFSNLIGGLALIIAALPTAITWTGLIPQLSPDFRLFSQVAVSVVCYLCIGLVFHYRRYLAKVNFGSSQPSWGKTNLLALLIGCPIASVISFLAYYHAVINNLTLSVWPLFAYICAFSFPVIGLSLMAVREYAQNKLGLSDETLFAKEDHES